MPFDLLLVMRVSEPDVVQHGRRIGRHLPEREAGVRLTTNHSNQNCELVALNKASLWQYFQE